MEAAMTFLTRDRRHVRRHKCVEDHGVVSVRIRPGHHAAVVDLSADGVLIETSYRLRPGHGVEIHMETNSRRATVRGRVLRCAVSRVRPSSVCYRGAIGFDTQLPWLVEDPGYPVPTTQTRAGAPFRASATPEVA
jgi:hypothetical protein